MRLLLASAAVALLLSGCGGGVSKPQAKSQADSHAKADSTPTCVQLKAATDNTDLAGLMAGVFDVGNVNGHSQVTAKLQQLKAATAGAPDGLQTATAGLELALTELLGAAPPTEPQVQRAQQALLNFGREVQLACG